MDFQVSFFLWYFIHFLCFSSKSTAFPHTNCRVSLCPTVTTFAVYFGLFTQQVRAYSASLGISIMPSYIGFPCKLRKLATRFKIPPGQNKMEDRYRSRALKSRSKLKAAIGSRAAFGNFLLNEKSLFTKTFGEKVLTLAKSRGS